MGITNNSTLQQSQKPHSEGTTKLKRCLFEISLESSKNVLVQLQLNRSFDEQRWTLKVPFHGCSSWWNSSDDNTLLMD